VRLIRLKLDLLNFKLNPMTLPCFPSGPLRSGSEDERSRGHQHETSTYLVRKQIGRCLEATTSASRTLASDAKSACRSRVIPHGQGNVGLFRAQSNWARHHKPVTFSLKRFPIVRKGRFRVACIRRRK
jgi:hypothetical protein